MSPFRNRPCARVRGRRSALFPGNRAVQTCTGTHLPPQRMLKLIGVLSTAICRPSLQSSAEAERLCVLKSSAVLKYNNWAGSQILLFFSLLDEFFSGWSRKVCPCPLSGTEPENFLTVSGLSGEQTGFLSNNVRKSFSSLSNGILRVSLPQHVLQNFIFWSSF